MINQEIESNHESKSSSPRNNEKEPIQSLSKKSSELDIHNYKFENKDIEATCENFIEGLFLVDPKNFDSFGQNQVKINPT